MNEPIEGGCLCGAIRYSIVADAIETACCHCQQCQRSTGSPVVNWVNFPRDAFRYTAGSPDVFASSDKARREHCSRCGTQLVFRSLVNTDTIDVTVNSLDNPEQFPPDYHIWFDERVSWLNYDDGLPRYAGDAPDD